MAESSIGPSAPASSAPSVSPLEQEVLDAYTTLLNNLNKVRATTLSSLPHLSPAFPPFPSVYSLARSMPHISDLISH